MEYIREPHKAYSLLYHLIFIVKYRQKVFLNIIGIIKDTKTKILKLSNIFEVKVVELNPLGIGSSKLHLI